MRKGHGVEVGVDLQMKLCKFTKYLQLEVLLLGLHVYREARASKRDFEASSRQEEGAPPPP